ncbi:MAG: methyltransferase domain-containing protein [Bacteroidia bacterium]|nr:methyltransferase domain-containing protein [Bacteroidia bacterium]
MFKYLRLKIFQTALRPISLYHRKKRSLLFVNSFNIEAGMSILDVGGHPKIWDHVSIPLKITCLNLPGAIKNKYKTHHKITYVDGDGCFMPQFRDNSFDIAFSNSVIEHVGSTKNRKLFAKEIRRISNNYWIQTPHRYFPIEAHCDMPFWWFFPKKLKIYFISRWRKKLPGWTQMVESTTVVSQKELKDLFPEAKILTEWMFFPKSLIAYSKYQKVQRDDNETNH